MLLHKYIDEIEKLPNKDKYEKKDILNSNFELYNKENISIYYAPHNETINKDAKIFIVGITPGWSQTSIAYKTAKECLTAKMELVSISKECKKQARFAGSMRNNIISMLDDLKLNQYLEIKSCSELFDLRDDLLHTTSLIPYPVFINEKNYTGSNPEILDSEILLKYVEEYFYKEVKELKNVLIIPLGKAVEKILIYMIQKGIISEEQCLLGFPHPSGANGHRKEQFEKEKENMKNKLKTYCKVFKNN